MIFAHVSHGQIFDSEGVNLVIVDESSRGLVQKVFAGVGNPLVDPRHTLM